MTFRPRHVEIGGVPEPADYYLDLLKKGYVEVGIRKAAKEADALLLGDKKDPLGALEKLRNGIVSIDANQMAPFIHDYRESAGLLWQVYCAAAIGGGDLGLKFGWPTLDAMAGGIQDGDVVSIAGRPGLGKTWLMLWSALSMWMQGLPVLFISMEIKPTPILQRIWAIHSRIAPSHLKVGLMTTEEKKDYQKVLSELPGMSHPFWVVDGNLKATVSDVQALALQLKPGAILLDGAYLMKHPTEKDVSANFGTRGGECLRLERNDALRRAWIVALRTLLSSVSRCFGAERVQRS